MDRVVEIVDVSKAFGRTVAVDRVTFDVRAGETVSLLGPSGCGKTTTLRLIAGFESPDRGTIRISGHDMRGRRPYERNIGLLFQSYALFPHMTVADNIGYGLRHRGVPRGAAASRVGEMLELVKLTGFEARYPRQLSGGQQQRVALARCLATRPKVLLLDEPLSALDAKLRQELRIELKEILTAVGATTIVVTHDQEEAMSLAERVIVMRQGRVVQQGSPDEVYSRPRSRFVAEFIGRSNWLRGRVRRRLTDTLCEATTEDGITVRIPAQPLSTEVDICIRPEHLEITWDPVNEHQAPVMNLISGRLVDISHLGAERHLVVEVGKNIRLLVIEPNRHQRAGQRGDPVTVCFRPQDCIVCAREEGTDHHSL